MATRRFAALALTLTGTLVVGGCTLSGSEPTPATNAAAAPSTGSTAPPSPSQTPDGPTPEQMSADLIALAAADLPAPLGSQTVRIEVSGGPAADVTVDVLELRRTRDATLLRLQMSTAEPVGLPEYGTFSDRGSPNREFLDRLNLFDAQDGVRHYPLSWLRVATDDPAPADGPPTRACARTSVSPSPCPRRRWSWTSCTGRSRRT
ncbi:hypothetical protein [Jannaschia sp. R86511]|uniref:hypothetical protein n=1 Tax=Jannaschia sp. R86511 TaxID=3093853 RepID=UPI0036D43A37